MASDRILIVDDDEDLCVQLAEALQDSGFNVQYTSDPLVAKSLIEGSDFKVVILDYRMPGLTGIDLLKVVKRKCLATKVFIASGRPFIEKILREENVAHLVTEVITKPFDVEALFGKLRI